MKSGFRDLCVASAALTLIFGGGPASAAANLLTNGSFETGNFSGWKVLNDGFTGTPIVTGSVDGIAPEDGSHQVSLTGSGPQIAQTVKDTPGENVSISFWYASPDQFTDFFLILNGNKIRINIPSSSSYQRFSFVPDSFKATGSETIEIDTDFMDTAETIFVDNFSIVPILGVSPGVPEVSTWAMTLAGFVGIALAGLRIRRRSAPPPNRGLSELQMGAL
jgi:hypothetical protein